MSNHAAWVHNDRFTYLSMFLSCVIADLWIRFFYANYKYDMEVSYN